MKNNKLEEIQTVEKKLTIRAKLLDKSIKDCIQIFGRWYVFEIEGESDIPLPRAVNNHTNIGLRYEQLKKEIRNYI